MIPLWKKVLSWIYPINIESITSETSDSLEVNLQYGNLVVDTKKANYSFGNLHLVFQEAIQSLGIKNDKKYSVLILGFGAGSIANILINEQQLNCAITGIEIDKTIIYLSKKYFNNNINDYTTIINTDALEFIRTNKIHYDLVFVDLFINTQVPETFQSKEFLKHLKRAKKDTGILLMNSMINTTTLNKNWKEVFNTDNHLTIQDNKVFIYKN